MKNILLLIICLFIILNLQAQNNQSDSNDKNRLSLAVYIPDQIENLPEVARGILTNKLDQIITQNGLGSSSVNERFIVTANIGVTSKVITSTAPAMIVLSLDITFYVGDGFEGTKFSSTTLSIKGVGENETKAYIAAIKNIKSDNIALANFLNNGKSKIISYYNTNCDFIMAEAKSLESQGKYEETFYKLSSIPNISKNCYIKALSAIIPIYKKNIDNICKVKLLEAKTVWAASQNMNGAISVGNILSQISPNSTCFTDVKSFVNVVGKRVKEIDQRGWNFILKEQQLDADIIKAARDIGVAYGNGQAKTIVYHTRGWW